MEDQIEKLVNHAGGAGRYQKIILVIGFFMWSCLCFHNTSIAMLETVPKVKVKGEDKVKKLDYDICKGEYEVVETYGFSWVIEMEIECNQAKVGLIGMFVNLGITAGTLSFSFMTKYLTYKALVRIFVFFYASFIFLMTIIKNYYFGLFCLFTVGIGNGMATMSIMTIVSESVTTSKRSLFQGIINVGLSFSPVMYTPLLVLFGKWRYIFWLHNVICVGCGILFWLIGEDSARTYFSKNKTEEAISILKRIAAFNGKLDEFKEAINDKEFESLLKNEQEGIEKDLNLEKPKFGYSALFHYKSVRYKFLIFTFMFMSTSFLTVAVVLGAKNMEGNVYLIIVSLYCVEILAGVSCGFLINMPILGRKKSLIIFYLGITAGFIISTLFPNSAIACWLAMIPIRFCITSVYTTFYIYFMESYPTPLRSLGFGLNSTFGNLAGMVSPMIIEYIHKYILYIIFAILCGFNIFFTLFLKETIGKPMLETIEELEAPKDEKLVPERETDAKISDNEANSNEIEKKEPLLKNSEDKKDNEKKDNEKKDDEKKDDEKKDEEKEETGEE